jgi:hypothetical protein
VAIVFLLVLVPLIYLLSAAPWELKALPLDVAQAWRLVEGHKFPLQEAAKTLGREALARNLAHQTQIAAWSLGFLIPYFLWRGFGNPRRRGWSHGFWLVGVVLLFFAPTFAPKITAQSVDYTVASVLGAEHGERVEARRPHARGEPRTQVLRPGNVMVGRAVLAATFAAFVALACHDGAYRLREALIEFGLVDDEERDPVPQAGRARARAARGGESAPGEAPPRMDGGGFGQRGRRRTTAVARDDPRARAYALLGLPVGAGKPDIERAYRAKMKRAHPDHGGSVELAAALNQARDELLQHS